MAIYKRGGVWWVDCYVGNPPRRVRKSAKTADKSVARIVEQTLVGVNKGVTPRQQAVGIIDALFPKERRGLNIADVIVFYKSCLDDEHAVIKQRTLKQRLNNVGSFVGWAQTHTQALSVDEVDTEVAFAYAKYLGERGMIGKTLNSYLGELSTVWKMLIKRSKTKENPWTAVRVRRDRENERTGRAFTDAELDAILSVCRQVGHDWEGMVIVGAYTGLRMPDISNLKWSACDLKNRVITLEPSKTTRYHIGVRIPMHNRVYALLDALWRIQKHAPTDYVFPYRAAHPAAYKTRGTDKSFAEILAMAGIKATGDHDKLSFHCLRHTFITRLAEAGVAQDVRMRLAGHTNMATSDIYTHDDKSALDAIGRLK